MILHQITNTLYVCPHVNLLRHPYNYLRTQFDVCAYFLLSDWLFEMTRIYSIILSMWYGHSWTISNCLNNSFQIQSRVREKNITFHRRFRPIQSTNTRNFFFAIWKLIYWHIHCKCFVQISSVISYELISLYNSSLFSLILHFFFFSKINQDSESNFVQNFIIKQKMKIIFILIQLSAVLFHYLPDGMKKIAWFVIVCHLKLKTKGLRFCQRDFALK